MARVGEAAFYTDAARKQVTEAVVDVESRTAAEVVVVVHRTSGAWREVDLAAGAAAAFGVLLLVLFHPRPIPVVAMPVDVALGFVAGAVLCASLSPLKRALLPRRRMRAQVLAMARAAFVEQGVSRTTGRTGLLVYVSTFERRVEVVTDVGVDPKAVQAELDALRSSLAGGADFDGFIAKLRALGPPLGTLLPRSPDDVNELPDAPVME
jgi:putative membrane protein